MLRGWAESISHRGWKTLKHIALRNIVTGHMGTEYLYRMEHWSAELKNPGAETFLGFGLVVLVAFL